MSNHQKQQRLAKGLTKGLVNAFVCSNLHHLITVNLDDGFVPHAVSCLECQKPAFSMNYNVNQEFKPAVEWFKPNEAEMQAAELSMNKSDAEAHRNYIKMGGLISREIKLKKFTDG